LSPAIGPWFLTPFSAWSTTLSLFQLNNVHGYLNLHQELFHVPGPVRLEDLYDIVPMDPEIETVALTGTELRQMLKANLESTYRGQPLHQMGGYVKRALGL
jgi:hypothetical protein